MKTETIKTYKHKSSGWLAKLTTTNCEYLIYRDDNSYAGSMAAILIEKTNDWDLVTEDDFIVLDTWCNVKTYYLKIKSTKDKYRCLGSNIIKPYHFIDSIQYIINDSEINYRFLLVDKQKEDGFEILKFYDGYNEYYKKENGSFTINLAYEYTLDSLLLKPDLKIFSIRRLSDNHIFTVGDIINHTHDKIMRFDFIGKGWVNEGEIFVETFGTKRFLLGEITIPTKKLLFITEDGVEIRIGDDYWVYDYGELNNIHKVNRASQTHTGDGVNRKYFSTKEKAEEHIVYNKPCLSLDDVLNLNIHNIEHVANLLKTLIISRLK